MAYQVTYYPTESYAPKAETWVKAEPVVEVIEEAQYIGASGRFVQFFNGNGQVVAGIASSTVNRIDLVPGSIKDENLPNILNIG